MSNRCLPHFTIKDKFQKKIMRYSDFLTDKILEDVCLRVTGQRHYTREFDDEGYNIGRLAVLEYNRGKNIHFLL